MQRKYKYYARNKEGLSKSGIIIAHDLLNAVTLLHKQDYWVIDLKLAADEQRKLKFILQKTSSRDLAGFSRELAALIDSGISILKALTILKNQSVNNKKFKYVLPQVIYNLKAGANLSDALACYPQFFPKTFTSMIAAGEAGGALGKVLNQLSLHFEKVSELKERVKSALIYPVIVILCAIVSVVLLLTMVIPTLENLLLDINTVLPTSTIILIEINKFIFHHWILILVLIISFCFILTVWMMSNKGREIFDNFIIHVPIGGELVQKILFSRFSRTLSTLLQSGVPILTSLEIVKETIGNLMIKHAVSQAYQCIERGESIALPLKKSGVFPSSLTDMIEVGEETGTLGELFGKVADNYERDIDITVSRISSLLEPFLVLLVGGIVGFILISILLPVYRTIGAYG